MQVYVATRAPAKPQQKPFMVWDTLPNRSRTTTKTVHANAHAHAQETMAHRRRTTLTESVEQVSKSQTEANVKATDSHGHSGGCTAISPCGLSLNSMTSTLALKAARSPTLLVTGKSRYTGRMPRARIPVCIWRWMTCTRTNHHAQQQAAERDTYTDSSRGISQQASKQATRSGRFALE